MPVRLPGAKTRNYEEEDDYSYSSRRNASRDFAQERRFGREDYDKVLSQVSSPLRVNQLGPPPSKRLSPFGGSSSSCDSPTYEPRPSSYRRQDLSTPVRHALAYMDDYESEEFGVPLPPQLSRSKRSSGDPRQRHHQHQQQGRSKPASSLYWDAEEDYAQPPRSTRERYYEELNRENEAESPAYDYAKMEGQLKREEGRRGGARQQVDHYVMPVAKRRPDSSLEEEEDAVREIASYIAKRKEYGVEDDDDRFTMKKSKYQYRTRGPALNDCDEPWSVQKKSRENLQHAPMFMMKLRSHVIWEKMYVKFTCTINGSPPPKITWYHDMVPIEPILMDPGKVKISNQYGVYTLEIFKAELSDSGTYRISAQNHKGEISSYATLLVRRYDDGKVGYYDIKSGYNMRKPSDYPDVEKLNVPEESVSMAPERENASNHVEPDLERAELVIGPLQKASAADASSKVVTYKGSSAEVSGGKFESVLELRIPAKADKLTYEMVEENIVASKGAGEDRSKAKRRGEGLAKESIGEFGNCLSETLNHSYESSTRKQTVVDRAADGGQVSEEVVAPKSAPKIVTDNVDELLRDAS